MTKVLICILLIIFLAEPASALELTAPSVPEAGEAMMPQTDSFGEGLLQMLQKAIAELHPDLQEGMQVGVTIIAAVMLISILQETSGSIKSITELVGTAAISAVLLLNTNSMLRLGAKTVTDVSEYGKLLLPVMTAAMSAQGGITTSAALYTGTAVFNALLSALIAKMLLPMVYLFLAFAAAGAAAGENILKNMRDLVKTFVSWCLKTVLTVFTTYMSITGVVSGTTDAAALKATKVTISSVVPVVGGILSDASEAVLVSAGLAKSAAGIYGIFAILAVFLTPFLRIGVHYLLLKLTAAISSIWGGKSHAELIGDFSTAMGLLLAMTGSACLLQLISTVCFLKGVG